MATMTLRFSLSLLLVATASAFSTNIQGVNRLAPLHVGATWDDESFLVQQAQSCADSESCSLEDAKMCLDNVIRIQSGCSSGSLMGSEVCEDVDVAAELVANLRAKILKQTNRMSLMMLGNTALTSIAAMAILAVVITGVATHNPDVAPFTPQELWWSIRDGYFPLIIKEYYENGGLASAEADSISAFTLQEVWWAIKGGYLDQLSEHYFRDGGLLVEAQHQTVVPFTPQEWSYAMKGGYLDQILSQTYYHGGLDDVATDANDYIPLTPQEWVWAAQGKYLDSMVTNFFQNGGL